jgi:iron complex outermembrane receptor protein
MIFFTTQQLAYAATPDLKANIMGSHSVCSHSFLYGSVITLFLFFHGSHNAHAVQLEKQVTAGTETETLSYLKSLSIEELLQTRITSVSKKSEHLFSAAAAVTVITQEDIERAGIHSIPEALRLVPGLQVAQIDGSRYAIGARGFNDYFANKLLVLIDGRSTYTPLFSGVYWNAQDTLIEDIDRIEVIRGPGATVWGANAVNGVINIITKNSQETQGRLVSTVVGSRIQPMISTRHGGRIDEGTTYRVFAKGFERADLDSVSGGEANDSWESLRTGFRLDRDHTDRDTISMQAEVYEGAADGSLAISNSISGPFSDDIQGTEEYTGGHVLATWRHILSLGSTIDFQMYYDHTRRDQVVVDETRDTIDLELKHHWDPAGAHDIVWGLGYRWTADDIADTFIVSFDPDSAQDNLWSTFIQDDINIMPETAWITLGSKFEHNDYTGFEIQPSVRFRIQPTPKQLLWTAVSRAVRTPSRSERDYQSNLITRINGTDQFITARYSSDEAFDSEELTAYEVGYRHQVSDTLSMDLGAYYNDYDEIRGVRENQPFIDMTSAPPMLVLPFVFDNSIDGRVYGFELQGTWQAAQNLRIIAAYSWLELDLNYIDPGRSDSRVHELYLSPQQQFQLRTSLDLQHNLSFDTEMYYVGSLSGSDIESYLRLDLQLGWQAHDQLKLSIGVENLVDSGHAEFFNSSYIVASEIPRQYWLKATYTF